MAGTELVFTANGLKDTELFLKDLQRRGEDTEPLMLAIAQRGLAQTQHRIRVEKSSPEGVKWKPSRAAELRANPARGTLVDRGDFVGFSFSAEATAGEARWGTNAAQGRIFQFGGTIHRKERQGSARLRLNRDGSLMRQGDEGNLARLAVFAKARHKHKVVDFNVPAHSINVIARPFLGLSPANWREMVGIVETHYLDGLTGTA